MIDSEGTLSDTDNPGTWQIGNLTLWPHDCLDKEKHGSRKLAYTTQYTQENQKKSIHSTQ